MLVRMSLCFAMGIQDSILAGNPAKLRPFGHAGGCVICIGTSTPSIWCQPMLACRAAATFRCGYLCGACCIWTVGCMPCGLTLSCIAPFTAATGLLVYILLIHVITTPAMCPTLCFCLLAPSDLAYNIVISCICNMCVGKVPASAAWYILGVAAMPSEGLGTQRKIWFYLLLGVLSAGAGPWARPRGMFTCRAVA